MAHSETKEDNMNDYAYLIENALTMELRVENSNVDKIVKTMDGLGFKGKNSWASMQLPDHTVIEFWKKELIKSEA
ncbi:hypothetical protein [Paenibacillus aceris]|uniref:Uncharacterized protein n=1 Tax=Paenibacillus aceris TaxID=869555 RepID=A0ABS4HW37_9BACL|nr:hypothetical protein [Paenibacillus aceris]MBP1962833.1 hypothetical protein [Paenibacillus aceris]NHW38261.1 hypothetical protein [Paenibacillus aceris]